MKKIFGIGLMMLFAAGLAASISLASSAKTGDHVTICHRTGSHSHPYVRISPSTSGVYHGHYIQHNENAVFPSEDSDGKWGDIIPPFVYKGKTYSLNWTAQGQTIWSNGCAAPGTSTTTTITTVPTTTTTKTTTVTITTVKKVHTRAKPPKPVTRQAPFTG